MSDSLPASPAPGPVVLCAKCEQASPARARRCVHCGQYLYVTCHFCGEKNERIRHQCAGCGRTLHRSAWRKFQRLLIPKENRIRPFEICLLIIAILITYKVIVTIAER